MAKVTCFFDYFLWGNKKFTYFCDAFERNAPFLTVW